MFVLYINYFLLKIVFIFERHYYRILYLSMFFIRLFIYRIKIIIIIIKLHIFSSVLEADYTLDDSFWKEEETPVGK